MEGIFRTWSDIDGESDRVCHPASTGARLLVVLHGTLGPGDAHPFHVQPDQEGVVHGLCGRVEKWFGREKLGPADSAFIPAGVVHGVCNTGDQTARVPAIFSRSLGAGFEAVDKSGEEPRKRLGA